MREISVDLQTSALDEAFREAPELLTKHLKSGVSFAGSLVSRTTREEAPKAETTLTHSIRSNVVGELQRMITSNQNYNQYVVAGTGRQGMPPMQSILDWVKVKRLQPKDSKQNQSDLAFMIARAIARNGTAPNDFYDRAADQTADRVADILNASVAAGLREAGLRSL
ncbi:hypothetical protein [Photobacterium galatheae]|uniref:Uncharacterized protein n=1 Tax=Photobacterium galatheae TaxID=1654360 RepID=A0A066RUM1_9GAMM|nr:hypothetical protein [Photobacterium galatheae]KDM91402.1 hypothetical protein EA58_12645 [Photobacterium galatheae]MCM0151661.1 hypothetical protein [Photobacterium galatheae]